MAKKNNVMSLAMELDFQEKIKTIAKKRNKSVSAFIRECLEKFIDSDANPVYTVILKIPTSLKDDRKTMQEWLDVRTQSILKTLTN
jgi:predicted DNA-binding ribbon-helix-helix protein